MSIEDEFRKLNKKINKVVGLGTNRKFLQRTIKILEEEIRERTQKGFGNDKFKGKEKPLKPLSDSYVKQRSKGRLASTTSPRKSNLTRSGQMLKSLRGQVNGDKMELVFKDARRNSSRGNSEVAGYAEVDPGERQFINPTKKEFDKVEEQIAKEIDQIFK